MDSADETTEEVMNDSDDDGPFEPLLPCHPPRTHEELVDAVEHLFDHPRGDLVAAEELQAMAMESYHAGKITVDQWKDVVGMEYATDTADMCGLSLPEISSFLDSFHGPDGWTKTPDVRDVWRLVGERQRRGSENGRICGCKALKTVWNLKNCVHFHTTIDLSVLFFARAERYISAFTSEIRRVSYDKVNAQQQPCPARTTQSVCAGSQCSLRWRRSSARKTTLLYPPSSSSRFIAACLRVT